MEHVRLLIPTTSETLFNLENNSLMRELGIDEEFVIEYVLWRWHQFDQSNTEEFYEGIIDDFNLLETIGVAEPVGAEIGSLDRTEDVARLLLQTFDQLHPYIGDLPEQVYTDLNRAPTLALVSHDLEHGYMVVSIDTD